MRVQLPIYKAKDSDIISRFSDFDVIYGTYTILNLGATLEADEDYRVDIEYYTDESYGISMYVGDERVFLYDGTGSSKKLSVDFTPTEDATSVRLSLDAEAIRAFPAHVSRLVIRKKPIDDTGLRYTAEKWEFHDVVMSQRYVTLTATSERPIDWAVGDFLIYRDLTYYLNYVPTCTQNARSGEVGDAFVYENVRFDDEQDRLGNCQILDVTPTTGDYVASKGTNYTGSSVFTLYCAETTVQMQDAGGTWHDVTLTPVEYVGGLIQANLNRLFPTEGWHVDVNPNLGHVDDKVISFNQWFVPQALAEIHNLWEIDYIVLGRTIKIGYTLNNVTGNDNESYMFGYGEGYAQRGDDGKSLIQIKRTANSSQKIITRLRAMGSTRNMPYRYYNKHYNLPQSMFVQNLQLPDTFETPEGKADGNENRDEVYGYDSDGNPILRHVLGDSNDAYIDKGDDASQCPEGIREGSAFWDGSNPDLEEIYPTIKEGTYLELRAANIPDMDGRIPSVVGPQNAYPNYLDAERIDEILGVDENTNIGDGIMTETDAKNQFQVIKTVRVAVKSLSRSTDFESYGSGVIAKSAYKDVLYNIDGVSIGKYQTEPVTQNVKLFVRHTSSTPISFFYLFRVYATDLSTSEKTMLAEHHSPTISIQYSSSYTSMDMPSIPNVDPDTQGELDRQLEVQSPSDISVELYIGIANPSSVNDGTISYYIDSNAADVVPEYIWEPQNTADTFLNTPFSIYLKDIGIDLTKIQTTGEDATIHFNTGACGGMDFKWNPNTVKTITVGNKKGWIIEINERFTDNTIHAYYPNANSPISAGDQYVLLNIEFPEVYIKMAEIRLLRAATDYLAKNCVTKFTYEPEISNVYLQRNIDIMASQGTPNKSVYWNLYAGYKFSMRGIPSSDSNAPLPVIDNVTIQSVTIKEGSDLIPSAEIVLNDEIEQSTYQKLSITVDKIYGSLFNNSGAASGASYSTLLSILQSEGKKLFLSKKYNDAAAGVITFLRGIILGSDYGITEEGRATLQSVMSDNFVPDLLLGAGWGTWLDENGISTMEVDNLNVRIKAIFSELEIRKISHSGGNLLFTPAGSKIQHVVPVNTYGVETTLDSAVAFRCDLFSDDGTTATMNDWMVGDQARCQMFNIKAGVYQDVSNRSYWRKVIATEERQDDDGRLINSVILAKNDSGTYKGTPYTNGVSSASYDYPQDGDTIVQLGSQTNTSRQNAIELVTNGDNAPALLKYQGINDFTLDGKLIQGEYYDASTHTFKSVTYGDWFVGDKDTDGGHAEYDKSTNTFSVKGKLEVGSTLDDGRDVNTLGTARGNLLRNTGFTGDYESVEVEADTEIDNDKIIYSDPLICWEATNVTVFADENSESGYSAHVGNLSQVVSTGLTSDAWYMLSISVKGHVVLTCGNNSKIVDTEAWERIDWAFQHSGDTRVTFAGDADIRQIMLTAGTIACEWRKNPSDNDKSMSEYFGMEYLRNAISEASTTVLGGLILSQIIKVGNYRDGLMTEETGGMSGARNDGQSPYLWGGGTMEQAIYTIAKYATDPTYQPTRAELNNMAQFVVTHGGRAILNDVILRGYIYALGGVFNGTVYASDGEFSGEVHANAGEFKGESGLFKIILNADSRTISVFGPDRVKNISTMEPADDAEQVEFIRIGGYNILGGDGQGNYNISPMIQVLRGTTTTQGHTISNETMIDAFNGLVFTSKQDNVQTRQTFYSANGAWIDGDFLGISNLPTSSTNISVGQLWNDNGTIKIKQ